MSDVAVAAVSVIRLATLASLTKLFLNLSLFLNLIPLTISIYPPLPATYIFYIDLDPIPVTIPGLNHHQIVGRHDFPPPQVRQWPCIPALSVNHNR